PHDVGRDERDREAVGQGRELHPLVDERGDEGRVERERDEAGDGEPGPGQRPRGERLARSAGHRAASPRERDSRGSATRKVVPSPWRLSTSRRPPWLSTMPLAW